MDASVEDVKQKMLPIHGGELGPIKINQDHTVLFVKINHSVNHSGDWRSIETNVLDQEHDYLFAFGDEVWAETGYDSDGQWFESKSSIESKVTLNQGTYYLEFETSGTTPNANNALMTVTVSQQRGSGIPHLILGILSFIATAWCWLHANRDRSFGH